MRTAHVAKGLHTRRVLVRVQVLQTALSKLSVIRYELTGKTHRWQQGSMVAV